MYSTESYKATNDQQSGDKDGELQGNCVFPAPAFRETSHSRHCYHADVTLRAHGCHDVRRSLE